MDTDLRLIVKSRRPAGQLRVYEGREALELDEFEHGEIVRRRIFYDEVLLVTLHRTIGWTFVAVNAGVAALFGYMAVSLARQEGLRTGIVAFGFTGLPFLATGFASLVLGRHTVTVCGRRSRAAIPLALRGGRAREVFQEIARIVEDRQAR